MSLRDQLMAKGLVSKKRAQKIKRELKQERKSKQSSRRKKKVVDREAEAAQAKARAERQEQRLRDRKAREVEKEAHDHVHRVRQIVRSNRLGGRGRQVYFHRVGDTPRIQALHLPDALARDLRGGRVAIAGFQTDGGEWEHHIVPAKVAERLQDIEPSAIIAWTKGKGDLSDPAEVFLHRTWESGLGPRRLRDPLEIQRFVARVESDRIR